MIKQISFDNFKCLDKKTFDFSMINVLSGYNGRGKSSVLQSLLILSQSVNDASYSIIKLHLSGNLVYLGNFDEILSDQRKALGFTLGLDDPKCKKAELRYELSDDDFMVGEMTGCKINGNNLFDVVGAKETPNGVGGKKQLSTPVPDALLRQLKYIHYISAERVGPVKFEERKEVPEFHRVGSHGLNTINTLAAYKDPINPSMNVSKENTSACSLIDAVSQWLEYIMDGGILKVKGKENKSNVLSLNFNINNISRAFNAYNIGFGYSYILSIIVTALIAGKDSIVIIENPEAHLHAKAQSRLTLLLSKLAERGVQVFIETHSEHIVNGFRLAVLREETQTSPDQISIYFFDEDYSVKPLKIERNGKIANWPEGFFDQAQHDLAEIIRLGSKVK